MSQTRHKARRLAVQALYTWQMGGQDLSVIEADYAQDHDLAKLDADYFRELLHQVPAHLEELDAHLAPLLDRPIKEVDAVERAVLRLGAYELAYRLDVPYRVVINEAVKLAKVFGADQSHKYINGILDAAARQLRAVEVKAAANRK
jgi:N utilization substance protein B